MKVRSLQRFFLEGLAIIGPVGLSIWVLLWLFRTLDAILGRYLDPVFGWYAPGIGLAALLVLLVIVGWMAERALGVRLVRMADTLISRIPLARHVYRGSSRIVRTVLGENRIAFQEVVAFEWPAEGRWAIGFLTGSAPEVLESHQGEPMASVYLPTSPNPASGYLLIVPRRALLRLDVTVEEAFTYIISAGTVSLSRAGKLLDELGASADSPR